MVKLTYDEVSDIDNDNASISYREFVALIENTRGPNILFDIETGPAPESVLADLFDPSEVALPKDPGKFDPSKVKYGNTKDPEKRREKLNSDIVRHTQEVEGWKDACQKAVDDAWERFVEKAALSALTGRVLAIGYGLVDKSVTTDEPLVTLYVDVDDTEYNIITRLWEIVSITRKRFGKVVSFNGHGFDFPMCRRRSWAYSGINPPNLITKYNKYEDFSVDVLEEYKRGGYYGDGIKLNNLAKLMGVRQKLEGVTGDMFYKLVVEDHELAIKYLQGDITCLAAVARRMKII